MNRVAITYSYTMNQAMHMTNVYGFARIGEEQTVNENMTLVTYERKRVL